MKRQKHYLHRTRRKGLLFRPIEKQERGQTIVLMALALVGLLVSAGLAIDGAMLMVKKAQLDRAVDAAALAGVVKVEEGDNFADVTTPNSEGQTVMAANGIPIDSPAHCDSVRWDLGNDYCGRPERGSVPGSVRYHVEAAWYSDTYFMSLIGIKTIPIRSTATAEYLTLVDIYASDTSERGLLNLSNQSLWGPWRFADQGDVYSAEYLRRNAAAPDGSGYDRNPAWKDLYGVYTYRIRVPDEKIYEHDDVRIEIFDPDTWNSSVAADYIAESFIPVYRVDGTYTTKGCTSDTDTTVRFPWNPCILSTRYPDRMNEPQPNESWFIRIDEIRYSHTGVNNTTIRGPFNNHNINPSNNPDTMNTDTLYRLYYLQQLSDGTLQQVDLAFYIGDGNDSHTDMRWVSPGAPEDERMPAFNGTATRGGDNPLTDSRVIQSIFAELGIEESDKPFEAAAEPGTVTEDCEEYQAAHQGPASAKGHTQAEFCTGDGNFIIDLEGPDSEVPGIYVDPNSGIRDIYLEVRTLNNYSENGFSFWAGPPRSADENDFLYTVPSEVNARQTYIIAGESRLQDEGHSEQIHRSEGVAVFGIGHLPMNTDITTTSDNPAEIPLAYLGPEFAGRQIRIEVYDTDVAQGPITFHFDTIHEQDWKMCFDIALGAGRCSGPAEHIAPDPMVIPRNGAWEKAVFKVPSDTAGQPFYGGRLYARYVTGLYDTFVWKITTEGRPYLVK